MVKYRFKKEFERLLVEYSRLPTSKKLLHSLVRFEDIYQKPRGYLRFYSALPLIGNSIGFGNEARIKRAQIYNINKALIKTAGGKRGPELVLTSKGRRIFFKSYPLAKLRERRWGGNWTMVGYDIPSDPTRNSLRNWLRRKLKGYGFGQLQQSLWVSPLPLEDPVQEFIRSEKLTEYVVVFVSKRVLGLADREIAKKAYRLKRLECLYDDLNQTFGEAQKDGSDLKRWQAYYLAVDNADPQLPKELLPKDWPGFVSRKNFISSLGFLERLFS